MDKKYYLGVDIGSTTIKAVLINQAEKVHHTMYQRTKPVDNAKLTCSGKCSQCGQCNLGSVRNTIVEFLETAGVTESDLACTVVTGSQVVDDLAKFINYDCFVSEVSAHVAGARHYYPNCKAILDVGGQDSKAMLYNEDMGMWMSKMSGICAAGTGAFLDSVAAKLNVPIAEMANNCNYDSPLEVSSTCAVLSATSVNKFKNRYPLGDVIAAASRAQARTIMSGVGEIFLDFKDDIIFQGGVAYNRAVAHFLNEITGNNIVIPDFHHVMGALGAACLAKEYAGLKDNIEKPKFYDWKEPIKIGIPEFHNFMDAFGDKKLKEEVHKLKAKLFSKHTLNGKLGIFEFQQVMEALKEQELKTAFSNMIEKLLHRKKINKSTAMRAQLTRSEFLGRSDKPLVWRNLFYPAEILNALGVKMLTLETYAALRGRNQKRIQKMFDRAACKGFSAETCSFLRVLEGDENLPKPDFAVTTTEPCQQGERVFADLVRGHGIRDKYFTLHTPTEYNQEAIENMAKGLEASVKQMEEVLGLKMDPEVLKQTCVYSNQARAIALKSNNLRLESPPLIRGGEAVMYANIFSQLWGKPEMIELQETFYQELLERKSNIERKMSVDDTHRLVWLHLPPFYSSKLMDYIELDQRAPIVFEEVNFVGWEPLDPEDPYRSLARKLLTVGFLDPQLRVEKIKEYAKVGKISGFVLYNHMFGHCSMADSSFIKHLREELKEINVPLLVLDGDCLDETTDPCSTKTKTSSFVEALNTKKFGNIFGPVKKK